MSPVSPELAGGQFLHEKDTKLHTSEPVEHEQSRRKLAEEEVHQKPAEKLADWMAVLEHTHTGHQDDPRVLERIKDSYHRDLVIKPEDIPESYFETQRRLAREQGHGDIEITDEMREQLSEVIVTDQESTLDNWVDYLSSPDSDSFPIWAKYWAFKNMVKLSSYDKGKHAFGKRDQGTVAPFPDLNREALAYVIDAIIKKANNELVSDQVDNSEFQGLLAGANFGKLYAYAIEKVTPTEENELLNTKGEWVTYPQNSDHMSLVESLQGHGTGWCTAGESTAEAQLKHGDFHVYYSYDKRGKPTIPRVAIRMSGNGIGEVRGIAPNQNLDPYIGDVVKEKLEEFPDGQAYEKKSADMKRLTEIDRRNAAEEVLTADDLRFLYQFDSKIEGFGYQTDPRIEEILSTRKNVKADLALITGYAPEQISTTAEEALRGGIKMHYGDLSLEPSQATKGSTFPESVYGNLYLSRLTSAEGLNLPEKISGLLNLQSLTSAEGLVLPKEIGGNLDLSCLTSAEGLVLPKEIGGNLYLSRLTSADSLNLPEKIGGSLDLQSLTSAEGLVLPKEIGGDLNFSNLTSAEGLNFPEKVNGDLYLNALTTAEGLVLPKEIGRSLYLAGFTSGFTSAKGLTLPEKIGGLLNLSRLTTAEGLVLPKEVGDIIFLDSLSSTEKQRLREQYPNLHIQ